MSACPQQRRKGRHRGGSEKGHKWTSTSSAATSGLSGNDAERLGDPEQTRDSLSHLTVAAYCALMLADLIKGHHFSSSVL